MSRAERTPDGVALHLPVLELLILNGKVIEFIEAVAPEEDAVPDDPLAAWEQEFNAAVDADEPDPLSRRLFPDAYPDDPQASAEFRRYTEPDLRRGKARDAGVVADALATALHGAVGKFSGTMHELVERHGNDEVTVPLTNADLDPWLKTLTALRLHIGVELGVETSDDLDRLEELTDDDPRLLQVEIFDWLGYVQESILESL